MRFVARYLAKYKKESIAAPLFKMLEAIFELLVPFVCASVIDVGIAQGDKPYTMRMCAVLIALSIIGLIVALTAQYFAARAAIYAAGAMRRDLFYHILDFSEGVRQGQGEGALVTRLTNDVNQVQNGINMFLRLFLRSPFIVFGAMIMSFVVDVRAALVYVVVIPLLAVIIVGVMRLTLPMYARIQERLQKIFTIVDENLEGVRVIRAFRNEARQRSRFSEETEGLRDEQLAAGRISVLPSPLTYGVVNLAIIWLLWYSGGSVSIGALTTGQTVALVNYMSQILVELIKLANLILLLTRALSSVRRIEAVIDTPADDREHINADIDAINAGGAVKVDGAVDVNGRASVSGRASDKPYLSVSNLSFSYGDGREVLSNISFTLAKGETLGIIGGTGSGKSTLVKLLRHVYDATSGSIELCGRPIAAYSDEEISKIFAEVPQQARLFTGTIRSNLLMGHSDVSDERLWEALAAAQADEIVRGKDGGLSEPVQTDGRNFSGGQRQRLTIARALLRQADITIFDDSASALDLLTERRLSEALAAAQGDRSYIIVSQRASFVRSADRILVLEHGEAVGYGSHSELMAGCEVYREIYHTQYEEADE